MARDTKRCTGSNPSCRHCRAVAGLKGYTPPSPMRTPNASPRQRRPRGPDNERPNGPHAKAL